MRQFKYYVKLNREIITEGIADLKTAKQAFKHGRNSYGSITELNPDGTILTEIGCKKIGGRLYCWA